MIDFKKNNIKASLPEEPSYTTYFWDPKKQIFKLGSPAKTGSLPMPRIPLKLSLSVKPLHTVSFD